MAMLDSVNLMAMLFEFRARALSSSKIKQHGLVGA